MKSCGSLVLTPHPRGSEHGAPLGPEAPQGGGCANADSTPRKLQKLYTDHIPGYAAPFRGKTCLTALMSCPHLSSDGSLTRVRVQHRMPSEQRGSLRSLTWTLRFVTVCFLQGTEAVCPRGSMSVCIHRRVCVQVHVEVCVQVCAVTCEGVCTDVYRCVHRYMCRCVCRCVYRCVYTGVCI